MEQEGWQDLPWCRWHVVPGPDNCGGFIQYKETMVEASLLGFSTELVGETSSKVDATRM